jgi:hypothetical protein
MYAGKDIKNPSQKYGSEIVMYSIYIQGTFFSLSPSRADHTPAALAKRATPNGG